MVVEPTQPQLVSKADTAGTVLPSVSEGAGPLAVIQPSDHGLFGPEPASGEGSSNAFSFSSLFRFKWLALGVFVLVSAATIPCVWLVVKPTYQANAVIRVAPVVPRIIFRTEDNSMMPLYTSYVNTQVTVIRSLSVLRRVLEDANVQETKWYKDKPRTFRTALGGSAPTHLERLRKDLTVRPRRNTELIDVAMSAYSSAEAVLIVNTIVKEYKRFIDETLRGTDIKRLDMLNSEHGILQREITALVTNKYNRCKLLGTTDAEALTSQWAADLRVLRSEYDQLKREHEAAKTALESRHPAAEGAEEERNGAGAVAETEAAQRRFADDPEWRELSRALKNAQLMVETESLRYGEQNPRLKELQLNVEHVERLLRERETQLNAAGDGVLTPEGLTFPGAVDRAALEQLVEDQKEQLERMSAEIEGQQNELDKAGDLAKDIALYDEEIRQKSELKEDIRVRREALEMEGKAPARISVADDGTASTQPAQDRRLLLTVMALGGAMMVGLGVAYLRASTDPKIREAGDVQKTSLAPFLGQLPPLPSPRCLAAEYDALATEGFRGIRTVLLERLHRTDARVLQVTSSCAEAGKTSVAVGLATSLAHLGKRTLLVEADLRRPSLSKSLGLESDAGLAALLSGNTSDGEAIVHGEVPGLDVIIAGEQPADFDSELLANGIFETCLERWKQEYEFILLDSPPVFPVADARILAGQADGTLMVLRSSHCRRDEVAQAYADLGAAGGKLLGTILVGVRPGSQYGYDYRRDGNRQPSHASSRALAIRESAHIENT